MTRRGYSHEQDKIILAICHVWCALLQCVAERNGIKGSAVHLDTITSYNHVLFSRYVRHCLVVLCA